VEEVVVRKYFVTGAGGSKFVDGIFYGSVAEQDLAALGDPRYHWTMAPEAGWTLSHLVRMSDIDVYRNNLQR
jgi:hypothetical protein